VENYIHAVELTEQVDKNTFCIRYLGRDSSIQIVHAITASGMALRKKKGCPTSPNDISTTSRNKKADTKMLFNSKGNQVAVD